MTQRLRNMLAALLGILVCTLTVVPAALAQNPVQHVSEWTPSRLPDGQPDIQGMWNNADANHTPLELPDELSGRENFTETELQGFAKARFDGKIEASQTHTEGTVGFYALYWWDWYWSEPVGGDWPALVVEPKTGKMPGKTEQARQQATYMQAHLHDSYENMEPGDRCISRGVLGMMLPTAYNNGTLILQTPGYVVIHSEMIHNARIIPIDAGPHVDGKIELWEGDPRGHWDGNTLVIESTNFRAVPNQRVPGGQRRSEWSHWELSRQTTTRRIVERFTLADQDTLKYSVHVDDPTTWTKPWTIAFPWRRDNEYRQYEYACHEGNYAVVNSLRGTRVQEQQVR